MINIGSQKSNYFLDAPVVNLNLAQGVRTVRFSGVMNNRCLLYSERRCIRFMMVFHGKEGNMNVVRGVFKQQKCEILFHDK